MLLQIINDACRLRKHSRAVRHLVRHPMLTAIYKILILNNCFELNQNPSILKDVYAMKYWVVCNYHISALSRDSFKELKIRLLLNTKMT